MFEWGTALGPNAIPHGRDATRISQFVADFFIDEARKSGRKFSTAQAEDAALIYNDTPVKDPNGYFEQIYMWEN